MNNLVKLKDNTRNKDLVNGYDVLNNSNLEIEEKNQLLRKIKILEDFIYQQFRKKICIRQCKHKLKKYEPSDKELNYCILACRNNLIPNDPTITINNVEIEENKVKIFLCSSLFCYNIEFDPNDFNERIKSI